ncbi:oxidoreductase family [Striga asiatica]|uniref:Oxidoreductase family n=1 Tax=Striga asiatica TaxID=4170 RepID=A0A5A7P5V4_STRAF|nr:oxidoreductase family [Striga asiatica]
MYYEKRNDTIDTAQVDHRVRHREEDLCRSVGTAHDELRATPQLLVFLAFECHILQYPDRSTKREQKLVNIGLLRLAEERDAGVGLRRENINKGVRVTVKRNGGGGLEELAVDCAQDPNIKLAPEVLQLVLNVLLLYLDELELALQRFEAGVEIVFGVRGGCGRVDFKLLARRWWFGWEGLRIESHGCGGCHCR